MRFSFKDKARPNLQKNTLSNEVEAKMGWIMYLDRGLSIFFEREQVRAFVNKRVYHAFLFLSAFVSFGLSVNNPQFEQYYMEAVGGLRLNPTYNNQQKYPDPIYPACLNCEAIRKLIAVSYTHLTLPTNSA